MIALLWEALDALCGPLAAVGAAAALSVWGAGYGLGRLVVRAVGR